ncbi:MAG: tRNA dihydrouridine synthase DusB [Clostridiaceae bacterium]|nr:tRNA dihydrouridine synthase DusB [Clostridiaceae bacterium]
MTHTDQSLRQGMPACSEGFLSLFKRLPVGLAPMAGFTTGPFRTIAAREGASFTVSELVSARGILHDPTLRRSARYLQSTGGDKPWGIQLFGSHPEDFAFAIRRLLMDPLYRAVSFIDLNMGCPAPKVTRDGGGCALMRDLELVKRIVGAAVETAQPFGIPITVKIRSGVSSDAVNAPDIAKTAEQAGAAAVTVHARTLDQFYSGDADWSVIRRVRETVSIPVIGNGDLHEPGDLERMRETTGCDGFQVGRAARGNPFIFQILRQDHAGQPAMTPEHRLLIHVATNKWLATMVEHFDATVELLGEEIAVREMRSQFAFYLRGFPDSTHFRRAVMEPVTRAGVLEVLREAACRREAARQALLDYS